MSSPLKVAIVGASGKVGSFLVQLLKNDPTHFATPLALVRTAEQVKHWKSEVGIDAKLTSVETDDVDTIANAINGVDAVVFAAGAGGKGVERIFTVDLDGCLKVAEACEKVGTKRFVLVSAIMAENRKFWWDLQGLREYYIAKRSADREIRCTKLDYTIVQPGWLTNDDSTGKYVPADKAESVFSDHREIARKDVALFIKEALLHPKETNRKTIPLLNGDVPVQEFVKQLD
ncbi:similar to Saccharomyces cerevisiae YMR090W Putative protein of unknown function with similarity to DTDP-glucose 4,6-dehydratases [Maudiozyma barnettii]|uniref:NAD(P)-binding domain-containing protein n=1 Tax=Maudiozyma barnettii TaxID=61262 RepID=A0A8H2ZIQ5_9SACH|nr:hypothetical protein [Kazachstania barnettii]CAB4253284.1 similar to Saccharomyces cerevisiae YMR090W Putative protein of unknown function with similarity to DTDP-glucose 4,6-dehydratases [Kazachstania barnettii]CAD1780180.1 similar to Saccharomyces cerevisiae YMR090W Putative protein of unknown function with similarity to DTDP-glucose 4,6-dehydratases [Kazachstania barnettii]